MSKEIYQIDSAHSHIGFKVTHMMLARVNGRFKKYSGTVEMADDNFETAVLKFKAKVKSISTNHEERDAHLRSPDFFDADLHKELSFISSAVQKIGDHRYKIEGFLTMRGLTNHIVLEAIKSEALQDNDGAKRFALNIVGKLNRIKWDMRWNRPMQSGGILVSREVLIEIDSEFFTPLD